MPLSFSAARGEPRDDLYIDSGLFALLLDLVEEATCSHNDGLDFGMINDTHFAPPAEALDERPGSHAAGLVVVCGYVRDDPCAFRRRFNVSSKDRNACLVGFCD